MELISKINFTLIIIVVIDIIIINAAPEDVSYKFKCATVIPLALIALWFIIYGFYKIWSA